MDPSCRIDDAEACARLYPRQARQPFNMTGQPAIVVPAGFTGAGLPLSLQLIGQPFQEAMLYRVAHAYERATNWTERRPQGLAGDAAPAAPGRARGATPQAITEDPRSMTSRSGESPRHAKRFNGQSR